MAKGMEALDVDLDEQAETLIEGIQAIEKPAGASEIAYATQQAETIIEAVQHLDLNPLEQAKKTIEGIDSFENLPIDDKVKIALETVQDMKELSPTAQLEMIGQIIEVFANDIFSEEEKRVLNVFQEKASIVEKQVLCDNLSKEETIETMQEFITMCTVMIKWLKVQI